MFYIGQLLKIELNLRLSGFSCSMRKKKYLKPLNGVNWKQNQLLPEVILSYLKVTVDLENLSRVIE